MAKVVGEVTVAPNRNGHPKRATLEMLQAKKPRRDDFTMEVESGEPVSFLFVAIGAHAYDDLLTKHPPTVEQRASGASFNIDTFAPALLSRVCHEPTIDDKDWSELWTSDNWGRGEVTGLFWRAVELCNKQVDFAPTNAD